MPAAAKQYDVFGVPLTLREISALSGHPVSTVRDRLDAGWPMRSILFLPSREADRYQIGNEWLTIEEIARRSGRPAATVRCARWRPRWGWNACRS